MAKPMLLGVADAVIVAENGMQMFSASLSSHTIEQTVDVTDLRGGRGNKIIGRLKSGKSLTVTLEDLKQTKEMQAYISGAEVEEGTIEAYTMPEELNYVNGGITLIHDPKYLDNVVCSSVLTGEKYVFEYNQGGKTLKVGQLGQGTNAPGAIDTEIAEGTKIFLGAYIYDADATTEYFKINSVKFAKNVTVILEEDVYDGETMQIIGVKQTIIPVASPDENFSLSGSREISETTASYTFTALASGDCNDLGYVVYLPAPKSNC